MRDHILKVQTASVGHSRRYGVTASDSWLLSRVFLMFPWISLTLSVGVLLLILQQTLPLSIQTDPQAADRVAVKMAQLQMAMQVSQPHAWILNEAELNQWMRDNLVIASAHQAQQAGIPVPVGSEPVCKRFNPH